MKKLLEIEEVKSDLVLEGKGLQIQHLMLINYLKQDLNIELQWFMNAVKLCVGFKHEDKINILKSSNVSDIEIAKISILLDEYDELCVNSLRG